MPIPTRPYVNNQNLVYDINTMSWVAMTQPVIDGDTINIAGPLSVTGPVTDAELRATPVPVSGPLTNTELRAAPVVITGAVVAL